MHVEPIDAEQARQNMQSPSGGPREAVDSINKAIREASELHRGDTTVFLPRAHIEIEELDQILQYFRKRGFKIEDRCHNRDTFAVSVAWYPADGRVGA